MAKHPSLLIFSFLLFLSCHNRWQQKPDSLARKSEPHDFFAFQRSYPDPVFDWKGWRRALHQAREAENAEARGLDCGSNLTNWTQQGPMNVGGRCNALAFKPDDENTVLAGFSGGGIFKSTDGSVNWHPVFDDNPELSIGDITFDPSNPNIVYAGTGDPNIPSNVFNGDGIYKSSDAGETWQHLPNSPEGIVSKIIVHPNNPSILWAALMGNPYVRDNQRGIYKSSDGGNSWQQVLFVSNQAGASDLVQCPADPQILYASFWDRIRSNTESVIYGPNARVYKSSDGGDTWVQLQNGLPSGVMGRTGLAISHNNPNKVYALYMDSLSTPGGLFKTTDGGNNWTPVNIVQLEDACSDFGWYFGKIRTNPVDDEELFFLAIQLWRKPAGNGSWFNAGSGHADSHDLVFTPSGRRYWANDGGVYRNDPGQSTWTKAKNLPITQFYRTTYNPHETDKYWSGAQDNGIQKGNGVNPNNWIPVFIADGFSCAFDPANAEHFFVETQNGVIHETTDGGDSWQFGTPALNTSDRTNWDTPFFLSKHTPTRLYSGTYRAYAKDFGGGWGTISGDLTDGNIFGARFHSISCINESPVTANKLVAGTTDGNVWRREAVGTWTNISTGLPDRYVTAVHYSPTLANRIFVSHSGFRDNEHIPHIHRSDDNGANWQDISSNLPQIPVNDIFVLPGQSDQVIFAATDAGVYFTLNGGGNWNRLGGNMPYIPVFDLEQNPARNELVAATFARGIWTFPFDSVFVQQNPVSVTLSGNVLDELSAGVTNVSLETVLSDDAGVFSIPNVPGCSSLTLTPQRDDNPLNGVTTFDLVLISKHILAIEPFDSPWKMIAADANRSGSITTFDIVLLRKLILGIDSVFSNNTSWRFVPADFTFPNPLNPFQTSFPESLEVPVGTSPVGNLDFTAIKTGDVNNTAAPSLRASAIERNVADWPLQVRWEAKPDQSGQGLEAVFAAAEPWIATQFTLSFDPDELDFESIEAISPEISAENFGLNRTGQGLLTVSISSKNLGNTWGKELFKINFRAKGSRPHEESLNLADWPTPALAYRPDGSVMRPVLQTERSGRGENAVSVWPSPFGSTGVWFDFSEKLQRSSIVQVFDSQGKYLFSKELSPHAAAHIEASLFPQPGVYFWKTGSQSGRLVYAP